MLFERMKRLLAFALVCALLLAGTAALAVEYPCSATVRSAAKLRRTASESGTVLTSLPAGDAVYVTGESGNYYIVEYDGMSGFVLKTALTLGEAANLPSAEFAARYAALREGDQGQLVRDLQTALIELGFLSGSADGKYGKKTAQAVADFQEKNGLNDSGSADAATLGLLFEGKPKNSKGKAQAVTVAPDITGFPLTKGRTGALVSRVQTQLKALDYYTGKVDGKYGSGTVSAVKSFQKKNGLSVTGTADADTQSLLFGGTALTASQTPTPKPTATPVPPVIGWENGVPTEKDSAVYPYDTQTIDSVNLRKGASTSSTRLLTVPKGATVTVLSMKGDFLKVTYTKSGKTYTGYVMAKYVDVPAIYLGGKDLAEDAAARQKYTSMSIGAAGERVSALQTALKELGFYTGSITGSYDNATVAAVKAMQKKNGLLQTGTVSPELQQLIFEGKPLNSKGKKTAVAVLPPIDGVTMREGDTGYQVSALQQALQQLGYYTGAVSGTYDSATTKAVKALQKANGLTVDGVAKAIVLTTLDRLLATPAPAAAATRTPTPITADNVIVIHRGTRGLAVSRLQQRLVDLGYYAVTPDGIYDTNDINAVKAFQKQNGLTADGIAGLETQLALYADAAIPAWATPTPKPTATPKPSATPAPSTSETLKIGSKGDSVNLLQARLTTLGYFTDVIDGRYGTQTAAAVSAFQENNGLTADGIAGPKTLKKVYASNAKAASTPKPTATPKATAAPANAVNAAATLRVGDTGSDVRALQQALIDLGYLTGAADGIFGPKTCTAVKAFQKANGLSRDGVAGPATLKRLQALAAQTTTAPSGVTGTDLKAPKAAEVRFCDWYSETRALAKLMPDAIIYDYLTGLYYNVHMFSFGKHADAEPVTASDTAIMRQIMGEQDWTPHAVWVIFSDGKVYMASTHSYGHETDTNATNGLSGHICIHFPREMTAEEKETMPYAVRHQNEIIRGWEETQAMIR